MARCRVIHANCRDALKALAKEGVRVHAIVTDPPYHLTSIVKRFGADNAAPAKSEGATGVYARASSGFMGQKWDGGDIAFQAATWRLCMDLLPPGGHLLAFGGTRTYHRMACAIEDGGFEIRDAIQWLYGSGFPKSHDVAKGIDRVYNIGHSGTLREGGATLSSRDWKGWGTAIKPACEIICLARKPLVGTVAETVLAHGTGAINIDACRIEYVTVADGNLALNPHLRKTINGGNGGGTVFPKEDKRRVMTPNELGRWPANVIHDGSDEVIAAFAKYTDDHPERFFYCAKADSDDRLASKHPTVKPVDLIAYLCRLVTPPGGTVLDPFAGSGTTGMACLREGFDSILIEREAGYVADINARLAHVHGTDTPLFRA